MDASEQEVLRQAIIARSWADGMDVSRFPRKHLRTIIEILTCANPWSSNQVDEDEIDPDGVWGLIVPIACTVLQEMKVLNENNAAALRAFLRGK